jgi:hypothetical protein
MHNILYTCIPEPMNKTIQVIYKRWIKRSLPLHRCIKHCKNACDKWIYFLFHIVFTNMHFYKVLYLNVKEEISFSKVYR